MYFFKLLLEIVDIVNKIFLGHQNSHSQIVLVFDTAKHRLLNYLFLLLRSGNACYHSVQNILSSRLLTKNLKIKIHRTIILPVVL